MASVCFTVRSCTNPWFKRYDISAKKKNKKLGHFYPAAPLTPAVTCSPLPSFLSAIK